MIGGNVPSVGGFLDVDIEVDQQAEEQEGYDQEKPAAVFASSVFGGGCIRHG